MSDFFSRSTEAIPEPLDFSAGSRGDIFQCFFQTFGCLVLRHGRLFVKSLNREDQGRWRYGSEKRRHPFFHATRRSRRTLCEPDVDVGISQVISMFGNRPVVQKEISEELATGWPIGQPVASPMSFNHWGLGICGKDWPNWPRISRSEYGETGMSPNNS